MKYNLYPPICFFLFDKNDSTFFDLSGHQIMDLIFPLNVHSDFYMVHHIRDCFVHHQFKTFPILANDFPFWYNSNDITYWTENHLAAILSSEHLIQTHVSHSRLESFLESRIEYGFSEIYSGIYLPITIASLLNLYDYTIHPHIEQMAKILLDQIAIDFLHAVGPDGSFGVVSTRMYSEYRQNTFHFTISEWINFLLQNSSTSTNTFFDLEQLPLNYLDLFLKTTTYEPPRKISLQQEYHVTNKNIPINESIWIHWSYGHYFSSPILSRSLDFMVQYEIYRHHDFHHLAFLIHVYIFLKAFSSLLLNFFLFTIKSIGLGKISELSPVDITIFRFMCDDEYMIVSFFAQHFHPQIPAAQQWPFLINLNSKLMYVTYGKEMDGPEREIRSLAIFPSIFQFNHSVILNFWTSSVIHFYNNFFYRVHVHDDTQPSCFSVNLNRINDYSVEISWSVGASNGHDSFQ